MKKALPFLVALTLVSCAKVQEMDLPERIDFTLIAETGGTRTVNDGLYTLWAAGDAVTAFHADAGTSAFQPERLDYAGDNTFGGQVFQLADANDWYVFYPCDESLTTPTEVHITVPAAQTQSGNDSRAHLAGPGFPLYGKQLSVPVEEVPSVPVRNALAVVAFKLVNGTDSPIIVKELVLTAPVPVAGGFVADLTASDVSWASEGAPQDVLTLTVADAAPIPAGGSAAFYAGAAPFTAAPGSRLKLKVTAVHPASPWTDVEYHHVYELADGASFQAGHIKSVQVPFDGLHQWDPDAPSERTYTDVSTITPGTYVIMGYEPPRSGLENPGAYACIFPKQDANFCTGVLVSDDAEITTFTTSDLAILGSEVELIAYGSGWLARPKESGRYLYYQNGTIAQTDDPSLAVQSISKSGWKYWAMRSGNYEFYHSATTGGFQYANWKYAYNLRFFKLADGGKRNQALSFAYPALVWTLGENCVAGETYPVQEVDNACTSVTYSSSDPSVATLEDGWLCIHGAGTTTISAVAEGDDEWYAALATYSLTIREAQPEGVFSLENDQVAGYLDKVEAYPYDPADYSYSYITDFCTGTSASNRLDWPKPVSLRWTAGGVTEVRIFNDASRTDLELSVPIEGNTFSADIYNLVPGREYHYVVARNQYILGKGTFRTTGRRRMLKVGSDCGKAYANNVRDLGGLPTVDGRVIKYGKVFRGSNMDSISDEARAVLSDYMHIGLDVDLREDTGRNPLGITVSDETYNSFTDLSNPEKMIITLTDIFTAVAEGTVVYVHCSVGTDRTGYVCMLLEALLGVPRELLDVDYELSSFSWAIEGPRARTGLGNYYYVSGGKSSGEWEIRGVDYIDTFPGETFRDKAVYYVEDVLGIPAETVEAFRAALL